MAPANEEAVRAWDTVLYERWKRKRPVFVGALDEVADQIRRYSVNGSLLNLCAY